MATRIRQTGTDGGNKKQAYQGALDALTTHDRMRQKLADDVEAFLARGGEITHLEPHMRSGLSDSDQDSYGEA